MIGFAHNKYTNNKDIKLAADSIAVNRGYGAFDFFGVVNGKPFYFDRHIKRFFNTMQLMRLDIGFTENEVEQIIHKIIEKNHETNFYIKLFAYPLELISKSEVRTEFFAIPYNQHILKYNNEDGVKLISREYQRFLPEAKSTNYLSSLYWQKDIIEAGAVDVLYHSDKLVRETSRGNVFMVKNNEVYTPSEKILKGITRSIAVDILKEQEFNIREEHITMDELYNADEVFLTSSLKLILPVISIDGHKISKGKPGPVSKMIFNKFIQLKNNF